MPNTWDQKKIGWYLAASEHTGFHNHLARQIIPILRKEDTLCDLGCGPGRMALEFVPHVQSILAIDQNPLVVQALERQIKSRGIRSLEAVCQDVYEFAPQDPFDILLLCFFGDFEVHADFYLSMCRKKLIQVLSVEERSSLFRINQPSPQSNRITSMKAKLAQKGLPYEMMRLTLEFGQPLVSPEDGMLFVSRNSPGASAKDVYTYLSENMIRTGRSDFPLYLPNRKELALFIIDCQDYHSSQAVLQKQSESISF